MMDWKDVGDKIADFAPMLGSVVGSVVPGAGTVAGGAAGAALKGVLGLFGLGSKASPADVAKAIDADPEAALKLKKMELEDGQHLREILYKTEIAYLADRQDARGRQVKSEQATGKKDTNLYLLAWLIVGGFFALCGALMFLQIDETATQAVFMLFGGLVSGFTGVVQYFFGSSKSSSDKTKMLASGGQKGA